MELTVKNIEQDDYEIGYQSWHINNKISYESKQRIYSVNICDSFTGCGLLIMHSWQRGNLDRTVNNQTKEEDIDVKEFIDSVVANLRARPRCENGYGAIQCTVGQQYYGRAFEQGIVKAGFKCILEFKNYRHCQQGKYTQRVYTLSL
jgi:hypothetical protein